MKDFLVTFVICMVLVYAFLFFAGGLIFNSLWGILIFVSLALTIMIRLFEYQSKQVEELKQRVERLEADLRQEEEEMA